MTKLLKSQIIINQQLFGESIQNCCPHEVTVFVTNIDYDENLRQVDEKIIWCRENTRLRWGISQMRSSWLDNQTKSVMVYCFESETDAVLFKALMS